MDPRELLQACLSTPRPGISTPRPQSGITPEPAARSGPSPSSLASALGLAGEHYQGRSSATTPQGGVLTSAAAAALAAFASTGVPAVFPTSQGNKIISRNLNGTLAVTCQPANESELQLYRVLQRANLLSYYDTFISQGGDDVQQLCEAGEEEFLEIMALVGMASKPLHVRRLQKALHEWMSNPSLFQGPLFSSLPLSGFPMPISLPLNSNSTPNASLGGSGSRPHSSASGKNERHSSPPPPPRSNQSSPVSPGGGVNNACPQEAISPSPAAVPGSIQGSQGNSQTSNFPQEMPGSPEPNQLGTDYPLSGSPNLGPNPVLLESQIARLAASTELLVKSLPAFDTRPVASKKKACKELEYISSLPDDDPRKMEEIRKYAAIYGRFDCKRRPEKPLTLHEVSVNEASAQICRLVPALLTRRDELFPLARQVVRESGYQYSKGHSRSQLFGSCTRSDGSSNDGCGKPALKRSRIDSNDNYDENIVRRYQERLLQIDDELRTLGDRSDELRSAHTNDQNAQSAAIQNQQQNLLFEQNEIMLQLKLARREIKQSGSLSPSDPSESPGTPESRLSSNEPSPIPMGGNGNGENGDMSPRTRENRIGYRHNGSIESYYQERMQVLSSRGDSIIAVANPALCHGGSYVSSSNSLHQYGVDKLHMQCPIPWTKQEPLSPK